MAAKQARRDAGRRPGRPRNEALQQQIKDAAIEVLARLGFSGFTLDRVCAEAGVTKATFYRRWDSPAECVLEALVELWSEAEFLDRGEPAADLEAFARTLIRLYTHPVWGRCMLAVQTERSINPILFEPIKTAALQRRSRNTATLKRALERLPEPPALSPNMVLHVLNGVIRNIEGLDWPLDDDELRTLIRTLLSPAPR
jgi:AcrR family transcriptional regulator